MSKGRTTAANAVIAFLTLVLAIFSITMLPSYRSYEPSQPMESIDWFILVAYGYWSIVVPLAGFAISTLTFMQKRRIWIANIIFQIFTVGFLFSTVVYFGWGLEYNSGVSTRNFSLGLSGIILFFLVLLNKRSAGTFVTRQIDAIKTRAMYIVAAVSVVLIIPLGLGGFDSLFSHTHVMYGSMKNPLDSNEQLFVQVRQSSPTLAANTPATIDVSITMNSTYREANNLTLSDNKPDSFWILFEGTDCGAFYDPGDLCIKTIPLVNDHRYAASYFPIEYGRDGDYNITLASDIGSLENRSTTDKPVVHVSPTEATNEFRTFKMSIIIGIIASALGLITVIQTEKFLRPH